MKELKNPFATIMKINHIAEEVLDEPPTYIQDNFTICSIAARQGIDFIMTALQEYQEETELKLQNRFRDM